MLTAALLLASVPAPPVNAPALSQQMVAWRPGEIRCDGQAITDATMRRPDLALAVTDPQRVRSIAYRFAVDDTGRPHSITREGDAFVPFAQDIGPALAASRFPAGAKRAACKVRYTPQFGPLARAPIADLAAYSIFPAGPKLPKAGWDRLGAVGNCRDRPRPAPLLRAFPDFSKVAATPARSMRASRTAPGMPTSTPRRSTRCAPRALPAAHARAASILIGARPAA